MSVDHVLYFFMNDSTVAKYLLVEMDPMLKMNGHLVQVGVLKY